MRSAPDSTALPPLVLHVVYNFDVGGLENGVVNLINHMSDRAYRHAVLSLTGVAPAFAARIGKDGVPVLALHKPPGHGVWQYPALFRCFRTLKPAVVHTRNLAALEAVVPAWAARVPVRVHGEHGRDGIDLVSTRYDVVRKLYRPFVSHYVALSAELRDYLAATLHLSEDRLSQLLNGVDEDRFTPNKEGRSVPAGFPFRPGQHWMVGTVGRLQPVKDQSNLARAFVHALSSSTELKQRLRLVIVGDGALLPEVRSILDSAGVADLAWLPGERQDVPDVLRLLDCFVLPSQSEGISNAVLEAMATGLAVVATAVGGNCELIEHGRTGQLVPARDPVALARSITELARDPQRAADLGRAARLEVEQRFSIRAMVARYQGLYDRMLGIHTAGAA
jgi:sugar transferase (PEP-CTERM/EpsH1 system associated)